MRLIQFTDPHLFGGETESLRGVATLPALTRTIAHAQTHHWPVDAVLVTGDLVQDDPGGYAHFRRIFSGLGKPVYVLPGNHDEPVAMRRELDRAPFTMGGHVDQGPWRIVLLDSCVAGSAGGHLTERSLAELDASLKTAEGRHVLVCLHHHPVSMSSRWLDQVGLDNADAFFKVIDAHRNVRAIVWGHVHQSYEGLRKNVRLLGTPATCSQFVPRADDFAVDRRPPAYRTFDLRADGTFVTDVVWVEACIASLPRSACSSAA